MGDGVTQVLRRPAGQLFDVTRDDVEGPIGEVGLDADNGSDHIFRHSRLGHAGAQRLGRYRYKSECCTNEFRCNRGTFCTCIGFGTGGVVDGTGMTFADQNARRCSADIVAGNKATRFSAMPVKAPCWADILASSARGSA